MIKICLFNNHVLHCLSPPTTALQSYNLRPRAHSLELPQHSCYLTNSKFITRMLFTDIFVTVYLQLRFVNLSIKPI